MESTGPSCYDVTVLKSLSLILSEWVYISFFTEVQTKNVFREDKLFTVGHSHAMRYL